MPSLVEIGSGKKIFYFLHCIFHHFIIIFPWKRAGPFIWTNLSPLHSKMLCAKCGWNWLSGSGEEDFSISSMYFRYFIITSPWKRTGLIIWTKLNPLHPRMLCIKLGWIWSTILMVFEQQTFFKLSMFLLFFLIFLGRQSFNVTVYFIITHKISLIDIFMYNSCVSMKLQVYEQNI